MSVISVNCFKALREITLFVAMTLQGDRINNFNIPHNMLPAFNNQDMGLLCLKSEVFRVNFKIIFIIHIINL